MAYEPLHHKYRPQTFAELVGQDAITTTLTNALRQQKIAPAYLFTGARGTGKTSSARILAKSLNCLQSQVPTEKPCGVCEVCQSIAKGSALDVIEIDAASNTGVDNIRELIERAQFAPVQCRYKVYVLDEVHMLTGQAFNALLKTLEEPPNRVVFVLATTDPQRVLPTIISRCQRFDFRRIELAAMVRHLSKIAAQEAIHIAPDAVQLVAQIAQGGLRDAESMLDQLSLLENQITIERVWDLVGAVPERDLLALVQAIAQSETTGVIEQVRHLMDRGREPLIVLQNLASFYRDLLIAKTTPNRNDLVAITPPTWAEMTHFVQQLDLNTLLKGQQHLRSSEVQVKNTTQPRLWLEVTLLGLLPAVIEGGSVKPEAFQPQVLRSGQVIPPQTAPTHSTTPTAPTVQPPREPLPEPITRAAPPSEPISVPDTPSEALASETPAPDRPKTADLQPTANLDVNLEQMWQELLRVLQPLGTQALFKQQGRLLALTETTAKIGITSQPLFKMAQLRVANLEAALEQLMQKSIKVSLEVVAASSSPASSTAVADAPLVSQSSPPPIPSSNPPAPRPIARETTARETAISNGNGNGNGSVTETGRFYQTEPRITQPVAAAPLENPPEQISAAPQPWQNEDDVSRAAKSLAQMFNGQIVTYEDEPQSMGETTIALGRLPNQAETDQAEEGDPDGDVPF
jgi:DNA polymerase-3 subunit gamma/tau